MVSAKQLSIRTVTIIRMPLRVWNICFLSWFSLSFTWVGIPLRAERKRRKSKPMPIHTVSMIMVYRAVLRLSSHPSCVPSMALTIPKVWLNMDLNTIHAADMDTAI